MPSTREECKRRTYYYAGYKCPSYHGTLNALNTEGDIMFHINGQDSRPAFVIIRKPVSASLITVSVLLLVERAGKVIALI